MARFLKDLKEQADNWEENYAGNIWGWKFSLWGGALIGILLAILAYRHISMGVPFSDFAKETQEVQEEKEVQEEVKKLEEQEEIKQ